MLTFGGGGGGGGEVVTIFSSFFWKEDGETLSMGELSDRHHVCI